VARAKPQEDPRASELATQGQMTGKAFVAFRECYWLRTEDDDLVLRRRVNEGL
jgi:hypothetical protein